MLSGFGYRCVYRAYKAGKPDSAISPLSARLGRHKMGCNFQEYEWKVKGERAGGALAAKEGDGMGGCSRWEDAPLQPCSLSVAVLRRNWYFVLTMLWLVIAPRGIKGKQGGRLPGSPAPTLHGPGAGTGEWWMMPRCGVCPSPQPHHPCFQKASQHSSMGRTAAPGRASQCSGGGGKL